MTNHVWEASAQAGSQTPERLGLFQTVDGAKRKLETYTGIRLQWSDKEGFSIATQGGGFYIYEARRLPVLP